LEAAQRAVDRWVGDYNAARPHQSLGMASPANRFPTTPTTATGDGEGDEAEELLPLRLPGELDPPVPVAAVEVDLVVPPSGNVWRRSRWCGRVHLDRADRTRRVSQRRKQPRLSPWQKAAREELRALNAEHPADLTVRLPGKIVDETLLIEITLNTRDLPEPKPGGLRLNGTEDFVIAIPEHALRPPEVGVWHDRFLGFPHVLAGTRLCLYLDHAREWQPTNGIRGLINRLWDWLDDAVNARFDPSTALYHAVGGVLHVTTGTPTIVVRHACDGSTRTTAGHLRRRTDRRYDHVPGPATDTGDIPMPVFGAPHNLPFGAGNDRLLDLLERLDYADQQQVPIAFIAHPRRRVPLALPGLASAATAMHRDCEKLPGRQVDLWTSAPPASPAPPSTATALLTVLAASAARQPTAPSNTCCSAYRTP
jgi:hypothetical protein